MDAKYRLTVEELQLFATQLQTLPVKVDGREAVEALLVQVEKFQTTAHKLLQVSASCTILLSLHDHFEVTLFYCTLYIYVPR
jgi:hypothetical protein